MKEIEKAKDLVDKFFNVNNDELSNRVCNPFIDRIYAKECALISVDEILNEDNMLYHTDGTLSYWEEVKEEIKKL
jgi:hypothetical protein